MKSMLVVTEQILNEQDIRNIQRVAQFSTPPVEAIHLLIPTEVHEPLLLKVLDQLALLDFNAASRTAFSAEKGALTHRQEAQEISRTSHLLLKDAGFQVEITIASGDPVAVMRSIVEADDSVQAIIITNPHPVQDSLNLNWTNKAQDSLGIPVLHLLSGTERIED
ncbi:hypothetical protein [Rothia terrae]|uniref:hypothetical protein n=1 Tax=Rothia terrae TaxID=396015 RepID=UPI0033F2F04E